MFVFLGRGGGGVRARGPKGRRDGRSLSIRKTLHFSIGSYPTLHPAPLPLHSNLALSFPFCPLSFIPPALLLSPCLPTSFSCCPPQPPSLSPFFLSRSPAYFNTHTPIVSSSEREREREREREILREALFSPPPRSSWTTRRSSAASTRPCTSRRSRRTKARRSCARS